LPKPTKVRSHGKVMLKRKEVMFKMQGSQFTHTLSYIYSRLQGTIQLPGSEEIPYLGGDSTQEFSL